MKRGSLFFKNKKGIIFPVVLFIILNLMFFSILLIFVHQSSSGSLVYEQAYAKEIALLIDGAKPTTQIILDFEKGVEIAEDNGITPVVSFQNNEVRIKLSVGGGYSFKYFSDYEVTSYIDKSKLFININ